MKVVELGGGPTNPRYHPNLDIRPGPAVDIVCDFEKPLPLPSNEYDIVYSSYAMEHISWRNVKTFIKEIYRILKAGGKAEIITANLLEQCKVAVATKEWNEDISCTIFGGQEHEYGVHKCGFSPEYAVRLFREAGFQRVEVKPHPQTSTDMIIEAYKGAVSTMMDRRSWLIDKCRGLLQTSLPQVLDIGSANGWVFRDSGIQTVSVDLDTYKLPYFVRADAEHLPFRDKSFPVAVLGELLEHVRNPVEALKESNRVGLNVLITVPIESEWPKELKPFWTIQQRLQEEGITKEELFRRDNPGVMKLCEVDDLDHGYHKRYYTDEMLREHLREAGIKSATIEPLRYDGWSFRVVQIPKVETKPEPEITPKAKAKPKLEPNSKLKIGLISTQFFGVPPKGYSGLEMIVWDLACALDKTGHEVTIFAPKESQAPPNGKLFETGEPLHSVNVNWLEAERKAYELYKRYVQNLDIIHGNNWFGFEFLAKAKNPSVKACHTHHGHLNLEYWGRSKPPFKLNLIAISDWMRRIYEAQGFPSKFVYNGINLERYPFQKQKGNRLLFVGRIDRFKQPHIAIEVARKLNMGLDIVGGTFVQDPVYLEKLKVLCNLVIEKDGSKQIGVDNEPPIIMYCDASHVKKIELMQNAKCLLFPSAMGEPFGLVPVEAMACGTPVVALNDGAIEEVVREGGIICDVFDKQITPKGPVYSVKRNQVEALAEAINKIDSIKAEDCRRNAEKFSREKMAEAYLELYRKILNGEEW